MSLERRSKLEQERQRIISTYTTEERLEMMKKFLRELDRFGKENFPRRNEDASES